MADFDFYFSDEEREAAEKAKHPNVTPLKCGDPNQEEAEKAFEDFFKDSLYYFNKIMNWKW